MVKKLFKHEIDAYIRTIIPMHLVLLGIALVGRFVQFFESESDAYYILFYSSTIAYAISAVACLLLTIFFCIKRFYSNLFTHEGYLSLTLPVTSTQHIMVKNTIAVLAQITSIIMIIICTCALGMGEVCIEVFKAIGYMLKVFYNTFDYHATLFIIEAIVTLVLGIAGSMMIYYACIALGQRAKKNRVACAIGVYFIYYLIYQAIGTMFIILFTVFYDAWHIERLVQYLSNHPTVSVHLYFGLFFVISSILYTIGFIITKRTMDRKLNLE